MKTCSKCGMTKALDSFSTDTAKEDGKRSSCRACKAAYHRANQERIAEYQAEYRRYNPDVRHAQRHRRRAALASTEHVPYSRTDILDRWGHQCCYCDAPAEHLDHVTPISKGGADADWNLVPACARCNCSKGAKTLAQWATT
ncbi:HNH endonuclease [Streptomyces sp. NBC_01180]|uniref:HNH endonuclease n=1 Tax=Streptomyces sp. NBC_01180 TaxID=2903763 RepID=UPI0038637BD2